MARRRKKRRRPKPKINMLPMFGLAAGTVPHVVGAANGTVPIEHAIARVIMGYTGFSTVDSSFRADRLKRGLAPLLIGAAGSMLAAKTGLNRYLKLPFVKL